MSSSGKGQSVCHVPEDAAKCWDLALSGARGKSVRVIVESFVKFESEITLLTVRSVSGTVFARRSVTFRKMGTMSNLGSLMR